jgi:inner membrane protein
MPTILTHPAVPLAMAMGLGRGAISGRLLAAGIAASALPDLDVIAFLLGIPYAAEFGHRGFSHSLFFALVVGLIGIGLAPLLKSTRWRTFLFLALATASHGILDAFTNGGLGIALLWPFSGERFFAPIQPIEVAPIGISHFLSQRGLTVLWSEFCWVWLPLCGASALAVLYRRYSATISRVGVKQQEVLSEPEG